MKRYQFNKLIRNNLPERMHKEGVVIKDESLSKADYIAKLKEKIIEEANEVAQASTRESLTIELADVMEVIYAIAESNDISVEAIEEARLTKREINGCFDADSYVHYIEVATDNAKVIEYMEKKERSYKVS